MGLEDLPNIEPGLFSWAEDLDTIQREMQSRGWEESNFGFHLGRYSAALDMHFKKERRVLVYTPSPKDKNGQLALEGLRLPRFPILNLTNYRPTIFVVADIPLSARALDSTSYPDQTPVTSHIGSIEILQAVGSLLGRVYRRTQMLPESLQLRDLALTQGDDAIIKLIPPLTLEPAYSVSEKFVECLDDDLQAQDPQNNHNTQIAAMIRSFRKAIAED